MVQGGTGTNPLDIRSHKHFLLLVVIVVVVVVVVLVVVVVVVVLVVVLVVALVVVLVVAVVVVYSGRCAKLRLAIWQACHLNLLKQMFQLNITGLRIPTGGRQTN